MTSRANIGIGIDWSYLSNYQIPFAEFIQSDEANLSHVSIVGVPDTDAAKKIRTTCGHTPIVHHFSGVEPAGCRGIQQSTLERQNHISEHLEAHWCLEDIGIWSIAEHAIPYFTPPYLSEEVLEQTIDGVKRIQSISRIPFLAEIPSCSFVAGELTLDDFLNRLVDATNCGIVLDVSHVFSYAIYSGRTPSVVLKQMPLDAAWEIHIAGGSVHPKHAWRYRDTHSEPILDPICDLLSESIDECSNLRAVTYEVGLGTSKELFQSDMTRLRSILGWKNFAPSLAKPAMA